MIYMNDLIYEKSCDSGMYKDMIDMIDMMWHENETEMI